MEPIAASLSHSLTPAARKRCYLQDGNGHQLSWFKWPGGFCRLTHGPQYRETFPSCCLWAWELCQHASWWVKVFAHADRKYYRHTVKTDSDGIKPLNRLQKLGRERKKSRTIPLKRNRVIKNIISHVKIENT